MIYGLSKDTYKLKGSFGSLSALPNNIQSYTDPIHYESIDHFVMKFHTGSHKDLLES